MSKASRRIYDSYSYDRSYDDYVDYDRPSFNWSAPTTTILSKESSNPDDEILSEKEALSKFEKACEGYIGDDSCCAIIGLKKAGWDVSKNPTITFDGREGFVLTCLKKATKELTA